MAQTFSGTEWTAIHDLLAQRGAEFGLPKKRKGSVLLCSFNIRKLGKLESKSEDSWRMLAALCAPFDLIAVQEVQDDLSGLRHLKDLLGREWGMVSSDITGGTPGRGSATERLAFLFRSKRVERTEVASDISFDRSDVLGTLYENRADFTAAFDEYTADQDEWKTETAERKAQGRRPKQKPVMRLPRFVTFIRQPLCVSFSVPGASDAVPPYEFLAVNAHLLYGRYKIERWYEFEALVRWLIERAKQADRMYHPNIILLGDCNFDLENPDRGRKEVDELIRSINGFQLGKRDTAEVNFPFLDPHPRSPDDEVFRSNARESQTYDQIGLVVHDSRLPTHEANAAAGDSPDGFDYGVVNFVDLFAQALHQRNHEDLTKAERKVLYKKFEHDVTDHMPIWIRLPVPQTPK